MPSSFKRVLRREIEVAFSKKVQSPLIRFIKYIILAFLIYLFRNNKIFWWILGIALALSLVIHFFTRYKTKGWTQSWGLWKYEKSKFDDET
jgi:hypothetical protein